MYACICMQSSEVIGGLPDALFAGSAIAHAAYHMYACVRTQFRSISRTLAVSDFSQILKCAGHVRTPTCGDRTTRTLCGIRAWYCIIPLTQAPHLHRPYQFKANGVYEGDVCRLKLFRNVQGFRYFKIIFGKPTF